MHLPREIHDKILSHFVEYTECQNYPCYDTPVCWNGTTYLLWGDFISTDPGAAVGYQVELDAAIFKFRLVSQAWCHSATALIQRYHVWTVDLGWGRSLKRALSCCSQATTCVSDNKMVPTRDIVRNLRIQYLEDIDTSSSLEHQPPYTDLLCTLFDNLGHIQSLTLDCPNSDDPPGWHISNPDIHVIGAVANSVHYGLQKTGAFNSLTDLRLTIPTLYWAGQILSGISREVKHRLFHLHICITDENGSDGSRYSLEDSYEEVEDQDDTTEEGESESNEDETENANSLPSGSYWKDVSIPNRTPVQDYYSSRELQQEVWDFVGSCPNLETLGVESSYHLDLDRLDWQPSVSNRGLRVLYLHHIYSSVSSLLKLLRPDFGDESPRLQRFFFRDVKIGAEGGIWGDFFRFVLNQCPDLDYAYVKYLTYSDDHERYEDLNDVKDSRGTLLSTADDDHRALKNILQRMTDLYGGPKYVYDLVEDMSYYESRIEYE